MQIKYIAGAVMFSFAVFGGALATIHPNSMATAYFNDNPLFSSTRIPAAIRHDMDFSQLDGAELLSASQKRLVTAARVILQDDQMGIELGHFVLRGTTGRTQLACDYYDQVKLTFAAEGMAESGEKPLMEIEGPCRAGTDMTRIEPIWVPVSKILNENATDMDLAYDDGNVHFHFSNMGGQWPTKWALQAVQLSNSEDDSRQLNIPEADLRDILAHPFVLNWQMSK